VDRRIIGVVTGLVLIGSLLAANVIMLWPWLGAVKIFETTATIASISACLLAGTVAILAARPDVVAANLFAIFLALAAASRLALSAAVIRFSTSRR